MNVDGRCLCGSVCFEAEIDTNQVFVCHCTDCQTQSGGTFRTVARARSGTFKLTAGEVKIYGGPGPGQDGFMSLRVGTIRQRESLRLRAQVWCRSSQPWLDQLQELPRVETQPGNPSSKSK